MQERVKTIDIQAFRGIRDLQLELDGKNLVLRGENGSGKSSIVEALEFFFTGKVSLLEGTQGLSLQRHGPHKDFSPTDVNIGVVFNPGNITLNRTFSLTPAPPENLKDYFQITQKGTFILRRSQLLEFILNQPANRFRTIGNIIGVASLDDIELEMMRLRDDLKGKIDSKKKELAELIKELSGIVGRDIDNIEDVLPSLNNILQEFNLPLLDSLDDVDKHAEEMLKSVKKADIIDKVRMLIELSKIKKILPIKGDLLEEMTLLSEKIKHLMSNRLELSLDSLLKNGQKVIEEEKLDTCPLCEQKIDRSVILTRVKIRLKTLTGLSKKASEIRTESTTTIQQLNIVLERFQEVSTKLELFPELAEEKNKLSKKIIFVQDLIKKIENAKELKEGLPSHIFKEEKTKIENLWDSISTKCTKLLDDIGLTDKEKKVLEVIRLIEQARGKNKSLSKVHSELKLFMTRFQIANKIYSTFSDIKKAKIQEIYASIQGDIEQFYTSLHANDPHKNIELCVATGRRASAELKIESFGLPGEDPRAFSSEGHLDSLGLCIFLAFVKKFNDSCSLIILDDVVSTIDAQHREHICKLLFSEFKEKQLIVTTHDWIWFEQLRASQRALGLDGNFKNMTIIDWDIKTGPILRPYKVRWERILEKIAEGDKKGAGNEGRQYLEWLLETIGINIEAHVPIRPTGRYEIRDLFNPVRKRIEKIIKDDTIKSDFLYHFQELEITGIMGNILSHNNPLAESVSIKEVKRFCECVKNLHNQFRCPNCNYLLIYNHDFKILRCSNSKCVNPLEIKTK